MTNKVFGYSLIGLGLIIILGTLYSSYNIFTAKSKAPEIFPVPLVTDNQSSAKSQDIQKQLEETIKKQIGDILPIDSVPKLLNLISWSILAGILVLGGGQVAGLGIKMLK